MPANLTTIRDKAFAGCANLTNITLPNTTTSVAAYSFADCPQITTVTTPTVASFAYWFAPWSNNSEGYTYIDRTYSGTYVPTSLKTVTVTGDTVAYEAFYGWTTLENVILTENVKTIERYAFYHNSGITSLSLPSSISKLENWSFKDSQIDEIHIPSIQDWCEIEFEHLAEPKYNNPNSINHYYTEVLAGPTLYVNNEPVIDLVIPNDVTEIPDNAFHNYRKLKTLQVEGQNLQRIGVDAFYNTGLTTVELSDSVTEISGWAFAECNLLESITLPASLTTIEERTFYYCRQLNNVVIPDSVTSIGDYAFFACTALSNITFSANLKTIGNSAFNTCYVLRSPALPEGLKSIGDFAFGNGHVSGYLRIPSTVEELGVSILLNSGMGTIYVTYGNQHFSVEGDVLYNFDKTKMVTSTAYMSGTFTIPSTVKTICSGAFNDTQFLTGIVIPASVTKIETRAMGDCESVTSLRFLGTKAQWLAIEKEEGWNKTSYGGLPVTTITCSDGVLSLS